MTYSIDGWQDARDVEGDDAGVGRHAGNADDRQLDDLTGGESCGSSGAIAAVHQAHRRRPACSALRPTSSSSRRRR